MVPEVGLRLVVGVRGVQNRDSILEVGVMELCAHIRVRAVEVANDGTRLCACAAIEQAEAALELVVVEEPAPG